MTCCPALENTRPALRAGIGDAERELEECRVRCEELEAMIARARVLLSEGMRAPFLAAEINRTRLYLARDGRPVTSHQIHARVHHYPQLFERAVGGIKARV